MGKRVNVESHHDNHHQHVTPVTTGQRNIRKRKCNNTNLSSCEKVKLLRHLNASHNNYWHENDDEDSSSNDGNLTGILTPRNASSKHANNSSILLNNSLNLNLTNNNDNNSPLTESPKPVYTLRPSIVNGTVLSDLTEKPWRLGRPIGKGNFGEIFLASDNISIPVTNENAKFVVKIEPHSNGPLFVEIHCLMSTADKSSNIKDEKVKQHEEERKPQVAGASNNIPRNVPSGIPDYIASGSHYFGNARYRFLVLPRFDRDLHSLIRKCRIHQKSVLTLAIQIINVLENLHDTGYCHNDVKAQNLMISKCKYLMQQQQKKTSSSTTTESYLNRNTGGSGRVKHIKSSKYDHYEEKQQTTDSGNSSEQEANDDDVEDYTVKRKVYNKDVDRTYQTNDDNEEDEDDEYEEDEEDENETEEEWKQEEEDEDEDEDFDDGTTTNSMNSNSMDTFRTPSNRNTRLSDNKSLTSRNVVQYSGSNPVRSCRRDKRNSIYDEMVKSHYLRPTKRISYSEFFNEDDVPIKGERRGSAGRSVSSSETHYITSDDESEDLVPLSLRRSVKSSTKKLYINNMNSRRLTRRQEKLLGMNNNKREANKRPTDATVEDKKKLFKAERNEVTPYPEQQWVEVNEERIFLIDYGLASKFIDNGVHRPFVMDQRRAHDGTLEFTSRDAHMGAHSRRSDMECLGYNLLFWSQGYLPWKEAATNQQQEKVHRAKEYLMTDVRELLQQIYGKQVPKYLGEYLHLVGQLAYHERPDYNRYRRLFEREYVKLGNSLTEMRLQMHEIQRSCVRVKEEIENKNDFFEMNKNTGACNMVLNIMQNLSVGGTPFHERTLSNRVSPKNLRSKSDKKATKKKKFSWAEILYQDPDQIARERAEKEFDREDELSEVQQTMVRRYQGKPTYAILEILNRLGRTVNEYEEETRSLEKKHTAQQKEKNDIEMDECDKNYVHSHEKDAAPMDEDDCNDDYNDQSDGDDAETDTSETFEQHSNNTRRGQTSSKQANTKRKIVNTNSTKTTATKKLILKTPNMTTPTNNQSTPATPIRTKTRGKKATTVKKVKITPTTTASRTKAKLAKSTTKRGSAIKNGGRKSLSTSDTSSASAAASAADEVIQRTNSASKKRERRTRRCLIKTDKTSEGLLEDDSSSNFSPDVKGLLWKINTEAMYSRNCKK